MVFNWFRRKFDEEETPKEEAIESALTPTAELASETPREADPLEADREDADQPEPDDASPASQPSSDVYLEWAKAAFQNIQQRQTNQASETDTSDTSIGNTGTSDTDAVETSAIETRAIETGAVETGDPRATETANSKLPVSDSESLENLAVESSADEPDAATIGVTSETQDLRETAIDVESRSGKIHDTAIEPEIKSEEETQAEIKAEIETSQVTLDAIPMLQTGIETETQAETQAPKQTVPSADPTPIDSPPEPEKPSTPAWMRAAAEREARLERLQETAIETSEAFEQLPDRGGVSGEIELDEDFIWSAEVLAAQGRSADDISIEEIEWLKKLRDGLGKTRLGLVNQLKSIVGQGPLNDDAVTEIEALLLQADVGVDATEAIVEALQAKMREETLPPEEAIAYLKQVLRDMLEKPFERNYDRDFSPVPDMLNIWMMTGVNGAGKTTTIGKLTHLAKSSGYDCLIAAADTFRAAAVEQVKVWGERTQTDVIANPGQNTDPASVVFDAIEAAKARKVNLLLVDTAGRLQNKKNLMDELSKMRRIINTKAPNARIESLLVLDATLGQNGLRQAEVFAEAAQLSGVVLTKLDGSARGGVALAVVRQLGLPIRFIGAGEGIEDLRPFSSYEFVEALLDG